MIIWDQVEDGGVVYEVLFGNYADLHHDAWTVSKLGANDAEEDHELPKQWEIMCLGQ